MNTTDFYTTVFVILVFGGYVSLISGIPAKGLDKEHVRAHRNVPPVSKKCDDEDGCKPGRGDGDERGDRVPISELLPALEKESTPKDAFNAEETSKSPSEIKNEGVIYEITSKSIENGFRASKRKDCDDEDECGSAADLFTNDDRIDGDGVIIRGLSLAKSKDQLAGETTYYEVISKSMLNKDDERPKKDCDDEDECGSADDVFRNDGSGDGPLKDKDSSSEKTTLYEVMSKSMEEKTDSTPKDAFAAGESITSSTNKKDKKVIYEVIFKSLENRDENSIPTAASTTKMSPTSSSNKERKVIYEIISKLIENGDKELTPTDAFNVEESPTSSSDREDKVTYEIISTSMENADKNSSRKNCDDEDECGSADDVFTSDGSGDEAIITGLPPGKNKAESSGKTTIYEVISKSIEEKKDSTPKDAFTSDEESQGSSEKGNADVIYEIISKTVTYGDKDSTPTGASTTQQAPTSSSKKEEKKVIYEIISKSTENDDKESTPTDAFNVKESPISTSSKEERKVTYEIISKSIENGDKKPSRKHCDDEDECGSADDVFTNDGSGDEDIIRGFSSGKNKDSAPKDAFTSDEDGDVVYEIISKTITNVDKESPTDAFTRGDSSNSSSSKGSEDVTYEIISKSLKIGEKDSPPTDTFEAEESSTEKKKVVYEIISKVITNGSKDRSNKNCDDEDECGSADDVFVNDDGSGEYEINKGPSTSNDMSSGKTTYEVISKQTEKNKDSSPDDTFNAGVDAKYEIVSKKMINGDEKLFVECNDDDQDCQSLNGGSSDDTSSARRAFSAQKHERGPKASVESNVRPLFRDTSFVELPPLGKEAEDNIEAEMDIFPLEPTGILLYNGWETNKIGYYISLSIKDGLVELSFDCYSGPVKIRTLKSLKMNEWNKIKFYRTGRLGTLTLNHNHSAIGFSPEPGSALILNTNLIIGGIPEKIRSEVIENVGIDRGFTGYIRNLKIQGKSVELDLASISENVEKYPCQKLPCRNGGQCVVNGEDYFCVCKAQYRGRHCNEEIDLKPISFHGDSYFHFNRAALLQLLQGKDGVVSFAIRTSQARGMLLREVQKLTKVFRKHATVRLRFGYVSLSFNLGTGRRQVQSVVPINDGAWHNVTIKRRKGSCFLIIDSKYKTKFNAFSSQVSIKSIVNLYIGGVPNISDETQGLHKTGFKGCLKNFQINSNYLDFAREHIASQGTSYCGDT